MTEASERKAVLEAAAGLQGSITQFGEDIKTLKHVGKTNRRLIKVLAVSVFFDLILSAGLGWVAFRAEDASQQAKKATSASAVQAERARTTCESANVARKANLDLWLYVLSVAPSTPQSEAQVKVREDFKNYVNEVFAQRDCDAA